MRQQNHPKNEAVKSDNGRHICVSRCAFILFYFITRFGTVIPGISFQVFVSPPT
jgi:hypothetical protein